MMRPIVIGALVLALGCAEAARADIYAYTDQAGITHFSNVPNDDRYQLLLASPADDLAGTASAHRSAHSAAAWLAKSAQYDALIDRAARADTVQAALVRAVIVVESGFNPKAVSRKGAVGLMQLLPATAQRYGVKDRFDPEQNVRAGVHYLHDLLARYGSNIELALAAYNAGEDAVERYGRQIPPFPETRNYVPSVMAVYQKLLAFGAMKHSS
jgi:soluble lytic murein transglycosylase-like protein